MTNSLSNEENRIALLLLNEQKPRYNFDEYFEKHKHKMEQAFGKRYGHFKQAISKRVR